MATQKKNPTAKVETVTHKVSGVKKDIITRDNANEVIATLENEFDSHKFIEKFISMFEREYVELLYSHINSRNGIFRAANAEIGMFLFRNSSFFNIEKLEKVTSENILKNENDNQNWRQVK